GMIDRSLIEAAEIDGAGDFRIYWQIVMPNIKPAWLTMIILSFQELWRTQGGHYIYSEQLKTLPYALNQLAAQGGVARQGVQAAVTLIMMIVPIIVFLINQSKIVDTMGHSGMAN
ncbi:MAG: ABC transporter permease subunit, partial [Limnochordia bacterium]